MELGAARGLVVAAGSVLNVDHEERGLARDDGAVARKRRRLSHGAAGLVC